MSEHTLGHAKFTPHPNALPDFRPLPVQRVTEAQGIKHDDGKLRMDLISPIALRELAGVLTDGAKEYGENNWRKGLSWSRLIASNLRHFVAWLLGEDIDPKSKRPHLAHMLANTMMLLEFHFTRRDLDDRWKFPEEEE